MLRANLCGLDLNLTYPQHGIFPALNPQPGAWTWDSEQLETRDKLFEQTLRAHDALARLPAHKRDLNFPSEQLEKRNQWKHEVAGTPNGTINKYYGCELWTEMVDYALNYSLPWSMYSLSFVLRLADMRGVRGFAIRL